MTERAYTALVYHHPRGFYVAECLTLPGVSSEAPTIPLALAAITGNIVAAIQSGATEIDSEAIITSLRLAPPIAQTYTALLTREGDGYASYCPALGVASQGETPDEALDMLREASTLYLETSPAPNDDEAVLVERIMIALPGVALANLARGLRSARWRPRFLYRSATLGERPCHRRALALRRSPARTTRLCPGHAQPFCG